MDALGFPVAGSWFSVRQVADGITLVTEPHVDSLIRANFYHVRGSEADLIVDTGTGIAPLGWVLGGLVDATRQVIAVATHAHFDHVGGMHEFSHRLVHPREQESLAGEGQFAGLLAHDFPASWRSQVEDGGHRLPEVLVDAIPFEGFDPRTYTLTPAATTRLVNEGDTITLGSRVFEVLHTPGHSPGGICLLDRKAGVLFSGDTVYDSRLFDGLPGSDIDSYVNSMARLRSLAGIRMVCPGHDGYFDGGRLRELCDAYLARRGQAPFVLESSSLMAFGHTFRSYSYPQPGLLYSGETTPCIVTTAGGQFVIKDTCWSEDDYVTAVEQADLAVTPIDYPRPCDPSAWSIDEASIPQYIVIEARKAGVTRVT